MAEIKGGYVNKIEHTRYVSDYEYRNAWKKVLADTLEELGFVDKDYNGQIIINISQGGVSTIQQNKNIK